ncbi:MAG TPA: EsaB/YukD family protein [Nocardioides sp.]|jgi:type VII secretion integral membrane protein EccD|uniref:EsaB/YukD family protein n=1 Tax=Nocardioides sp. TaxID=35761 RepID=UPI002E3613BC|nr:EsaB/YukD family protein [Nocardioides sp.]HEX3929648.1 EsaB/YukD family protein [Nocardioides sp.]
MTTTTLVRVTVIGGTRRVDLAVPGSVPVAELLPGLARALGALDDDVLQGGFRLTTQDGRILAPDAGLAAQGVADGGLLALVAAGGVDEPMVHDDLVDAICEAVTSELASWDPALGVLAARATSVLLLTVGALSLARDPSTAGGVGAALAAVGLTLAGVVVSRCTRERHLTVAVSLVLTGCVYAAVAGGRLLVGTRFHPPVLCAAGLASAVVGLIAVLGLDRGRVLALPPVMVGTVLVATGMASRVLSLAPTVVLSMVLVLAVAAGDLVPAAVLACAGVGSEPLVGGTGALDAGGVDLARLSCDLRLASDLLVSMSATLGALVVLAAPFAVARGAAGLLVAVLGCVVVMLRTRRHRSSAPVVVGLSTGSLGLLATLAAAWWLHPGWHGPLRATLVATGACALAVTALRPPGPAQRERMVGALESVVVVALAPALVVACGLFSMARR